MKHCAFLIVLAAILISWLGTVTNHKSNFFVNNGGTRITLFPH